MLGGKVVLHHGDCLDAMKGLEEASVDACVTDPPYELGFMGAKWDSGGAAHSIAIWREVLRVVKPGAHLLAFGGTRTFHRLVCAIEDAGFEIRDTVLWLYGSGFPKSLDVSKAIDKEAGAERKVVGKSARHVSGKLEQRTEGLCGSATFAETIGMGAFITAPATDAARRWQGWATALKPACELISLARKPLSESTVAANVLRWGTGALNVDACRIETSDAFSGSGNKPLSYGGDNYRPYHDREPRGPTQQSALGRWPANVCHDGSDEVVGMFPTTTSGAMKREVDSYDGESLTGFLRGRSGPSNQHADFGSAARFFYTAKADQDSRLGSKHPTVKPLDLMRWLVRLVTPPGGCVLDPFAGTGTTGEAAFLEGFQAILIEREAEHCADIARRLAHVHEPPRVRTETRIKARGLTQAPGPLFELPG